MRAIGTLANGGFLIVCVLFVLDGGCCGAGTLRAPEQPITGPGGRDYVHRSLSAQRFGQGDDEYWLFMPDEPRPAEAPVVVFMHGWGATDPFLYGAWIRHIVLRGYTVIYPRYQKNLRTRLDDMTPNALKAVQSAMRRLEADGPVRPAGKQLAVVGHSMGGFIATNLAALAGKSGLPQPSVLMVVEPGDGDGRMRWLGVRLPLADLSETPDTMLFLMVTGEADTVVGDRGANKIWLALRHVWSENKDFVTVASDRRPRPKLKADHFSPLAVDRTFPQEPSADLTQKSDSGGSGEPQGFFARLRDARHERMRHRFHERWARRYPPDALDYFGYWKLFDGLLDAAFRGNDREFALGGTEQQRFMGLCSDGTPVKPIIVKHPPERIIR